MYFIASILYPSVFLSRAGARTEFEKKPGREEKGRPGLEVRADSSTLPPAPASSARDSGCKCRRAPQSPLPLHCPPPPTFASCPRNLKSFNPPRPVPFHYNSSTSQFRQLRNMRRCPFLIFGFVVDIPRSVSLGRQYRRLTTLRISRRVPR